MSNAASSPAPTLHVAVQMRRLAAPTQWEDWRHAVDAVLIDEGQFGTEPRVLRDDGRCRDTLHPGLAVELHRDEAEGYWLNLTSGAPVWFVMWRCDDADPSRAWPELVSLSYQVAGRLLDAQERVDNLPLPEPVRAWLQAYTDEHHKPEPRERRRPASFKNPGERR